MRYKYIENQAEFAQKIEFANSYAGSRVALSMQTIIGWLQQLVTFISVLMLLGGVSVWAALLLLVTSIPAAILSYKQRDDTYRHIMRRQNGIRKRI